MQSLDLAIVGNCTYAGLLDSRGSHGLGHACRASTATRCFATCCGRSSRSASTRSRSTISNRASSATCRTPRSSRPRLRGKSGHALKIQDFAPALQAARPPCPPVDPGAPPDPGLRHPADPHQAAPGRQLRGGAAGGDARQQSPALRAARPCHAADHQRAGLLRAGGNAVPPQSPARPHPRPRRFDRAGHRRALPRVLRADRGLLAGMGALHRAALRVAGRGDPRGHHPEAVRGGGDRRGGWPPSPPRSPRPTEPRATGITGSAGCATPISSSAR